LRIRIALLHQTHRQPVRTEHQMNPRTIRKLSQNFPNICNQRLNIQWMIEEMLDGAFGQSVEWLAIHAAPFFQAAERGGVGIMWVQWQEHEFIELMLLLDFRDRVFGQRSPVTHRRYRDDVEVRFECLDQTRALAFGKNANRRPPPNLPVAFSNGNAALFRDEVCQGPTNKIQRPQRDNVRVQK